MLNRQSTASCVCSMLPIMDRGTNFSACNIASSEEEQSNTASDRQCCTSKSDRDSGFFAPSSQSSLGRRPLLQSCQPSGRQGRGELIESWRMDSETVALDIEQPIGERKSATLRPGAGNRHRQRSSESASVQFQRASERHWQAAPAYPAIARGHCMGSHRGCVALPQSVNRRQGTERRHLPNRQ